MVLTLMSALLLASTLNVYRREARRGRKIVAHGAAVSEVERQAVGTGLLCVDGAPAAGERNVAVFSLFPISPDRVLFFHPCRGSVVT